MMVGSSQHAHLPQEAASQPEQTHDNNAAENIKQRSQAIKDMSGAQAYLRIFHYLEPWELLLEIVAIMAACLSGAALAMVNLVIGQLLSVITKRLMGTTDPDRFLDDVGQYCLYFIYIGVVRWVCTYIYMTLTTYSALRVVATIRHAFLRAALRQPVSFFDANLESLSSQVTSNGHLIQSGIADKLITVFQAVATFVAAFILSFVTQWKLTLILLCIPPALIVLMGVVATLEAKVDNKVLGIYSQAASFAEGLLSTIRTIHAYGIRRELVAHYEGYLDQALQLSMKKNVLHGAFFSMEYSIMYSAIGLAFWQGTKMIARGEVDDIGTVFTVIMSIVVATLTFTSIATNIISLERAASAARQLFAVIDRHPGLDGLDDSGIKPPQADVLGSLELEAVTFRYPSRSTTPVLDNLSLQIPAGKVTALVGPSGSGKSTVIGLLERWYEPISGSIKLDGLSIGQLNLQWLRTHIRLVQQEPVLFNTTVFENIANGLVGTEWEAASFQVKQERVERAAEMAFAHEFITTKLPNGYQTQIGERGSFLSGGQKQRIAIARSIVSDPKILLLDEATSALDPEAEEIVQQALNRASKGRTTLVIAHKLATVRTADKIVVMDKGAVVEEGTHATLIAANGRYARLASVQDLDVGHNSKHEPQAVRSSVADEDNNYEKSQSTSHKPTKLREKSSMEMPINHPSASALGASDTPGYVSGVWKTILENPNLRVKFVIIGISCIAGSAAIPGQSILMARVMNIFELAPDQLEERGAFYALMFFVMAIGAFAVYFTLGWMTNSTAESMSRRWRRDLLDSMLKQDVDFFDREENTTGALTSRIDEVANAMLELMGVNMALIIITLCTVVACAVLAIGTSWKLGLVGVFSGLVPIAAAGFTRIVLEMRTDQANEKRAVRGATIASESLLAIRTVSSLAIEPVILQRYADVTQEAIRHARLPLIHTMLWYSFTQSVEYFVLALGFWWGCKLVDTGEITFYQFFVSFMGVFFAGQNASMVFSHTVSITKGMSAIRYYLCIKSSKPKIRTTSENKTKAPPAGLQSVKLDKASFAYPSRPDSHVLRGVSLGIQSNEHKFVALVGASGSGKSTIVSLLERFYDPTSGSVLADGQNIAELDPEAYREDVALVLQEPTLYSSSIRENVMLGFRQRRRSPAAQAGEVDDDDTRVEAALRAANAWDFVASLPEGTRTRCGANGSQLSGGQKQRVAIARALAREPRLLLLDEATSALDTESEKTVQAALARAAARDGRMTVAVAHRLSTIRDAEQIYVFAGGKVVESGTHAELLALGRVYRGLCEAQNLGV